MFRNYLVTALRNIVRHKLYSFINIAGLAVGLLTLSLYSTSLLAANPTVVKTPTVSPTIAAEYVHPHEMIDIGEGRKMNLFCMGKGSPTVIFDAGGSDWSVIWALVQPGVAAHARACS